MKQEYYSITTFLFLFPKEVTTSPSYLRNDSTGKENLHFDDQSKEVVFLEKFSKGKYRKHVFCVLSSYGNTPGSFGELRNAVETFTSGLMFLQLS